MFGKKVAITLRESLQAIEMAICEGYQSSEVISGWSTKKVNRNLWNRQVNTLVSKDIGFVSGIAATGLRTGAFLKGREMVSIMNGLKGAYNRHLPLVVVLENDTPLHFSFSDTNSFQLYASTGQEAIDYLLIAHRIAELSLIPGMVIIDKDLGTATEEVNIPSKEEIIDFLGGADEEIPSPTPSQNMIFGKNRRRIPNWFSFDQPILSGAVKDDKGNLLEAAAQKQYFEKHLPQITEQVFDEYAKIAGREYGVFTGYMEKDAEYLIITRGATFELVKGTVDHLRDDKKLKVGCVHMGLSPISKELTTLLKGKKGITILDREIPSLYNDLITSKSTAESTPYSGLYGTVPTQEDLIAVFENMLREGGQKRNFWIGVQFTAPSSAYPKHEILLQNISREYKDINESVLPSEGSEKEEERKEEKKKKILPFTIRQYQDQGPPYTRLSRFYDDTAGIYNDKGELVADPFQAVSAVPPVVMDFSVADDREAFPKFVAQECSGCGECFVYCPHSAMPPISIGLEAIIKAGIDIATKKGKQITQLTPVIKNLAKIGSNELVENENAKTIVDFLPKTFEKVTTQMKLEGEKLAVVKDEFGGVMEGIGEFNFAVTEPFFDAPNKQEKNTGELFSLVVDPNACTGCGLCADVCEEEALVMSEQSRELLEKAQQAFDLWEQLPDTSGDTITRMHHDKEYNSLAAILLSRNFYYSITGGGTSERGASDKAIFHLVTAAAESIIQPKIGERAKAIEEMISALSENIHTKLSDAIPKGDFGPLLNVIGEAGTMKQPFDEIIGQMGSKKQLKLIDTLELQRKIELASALKDLHWALTEGPTGTGRSRYGVTLSGTQGWEMNYPYNHLSSPAIIHLDNSTPEVALGLAMGHVRHQLDNIKLFRRAELDAKDKYDSAIHDMEIAGLQWDELTEEERSMIPPIFLVGNKETLEAKNLASLLSVLSYDLPLKVMVIDDGLPTSLDQGASYYMSKANTLISAMIQKSASVYQLSTANADLLLSGLHEGIQSPRPALFHLLAPSTGNDPDRLWPKLGSLALNTRAFPYLKYTPEDNSFICTNVDLSQNPSADEPWFTQEISYGDEEEKTIEYTFTWADWAYAMKDWEEHFSPYDEKEGQQLPVAEYIILDKDSRDGKVPVIIRADEEGIKNYTVTKDVVSITEAVLATWNTLREVGGTLTKYPEKLRNDVQEELKGEHQEELEQLKKEYEEKLKNLEQEQLEKIRIKIRDKLVALSQQGGKVKEESE